jgi:hypothetical protein
VPELDTLWRALKYLPDRTRNLILCFGAPMQNYGCEHQRWHPALAVSGPGLWPYPAAQVHSSGGGDGDGQELSPLTSRLPNLSTTWRTCFASTEGLQHREDKAVERQRNSGDPNRRNVIFPSSTETVCDPNNIARTWHKAAEAAGLRVGDAQYLP